MDEPSNANLPPDLQRQLDETRDAYHWALTLAAAYWTERLGKLDGEVAVLTGERRALEMKIAAGKRLLEARAAIAAYEDKGEESV